MTTDWAAIRQHEYAVPDGADVPAGPPRAALLDALHTRTSSMW